MSDERYDHDQLKALTAEVERLKAALVLAIEVMEAFDLWCAGAQAWLPSRRKIAEILAGLKAIVKKGTKYKIVNNEWKSRPVKCAGCKPLRVICLCSSCGGIENGIAFAFEGEGAFVIDRNDLKSIVEEAAKAIMEGGK